jgi:outer membrane protein assembly factor BamB
VTSAVTHATATWAAAAVELRSVTVDTMIFTRTNTMVSLSFNGSSAPTRNWFTITTNFSAPVDGGAGLIYAGGSNGNVYEFDPIGGARKQVAIPGAPAVGDPSYDGVLGRIYFGTSTGQVYAIDTPF